MAQSNPSFRHIFGTTSLFGMVQVASSVFSVIKTKFIALLIGPEGMGIIGLLQTGINLVGGLTDFGLGTSAVRDLAAAHAEENTAKTAETLGVIRKLVIFTGLLGTLLTVIFSPLLSRWAFGNSAYILAFIWLSVTLLLRQLTTGNLVVLQGLRKMKLLAKAQVWGSFLGLLTALPLYYYWGLKGIVPAIISGVLATYLISLYYVHQLKIFAKVVRLKEAWKAGREMLGFGYLLGMGSLLKLLVAYLITLYISYRGQVDAVGLYQAGFVIIHSYVGIIFKAMDADYFPRLSAVSQDIVKVRKAVSDQATAGILFITPIICLFLLASPIIVNLLYAQSFIPVSVYLQWAIVGMFFKAVSFPMAYVILARADAKIYSKFMFVFNFIYLILSILGYYIDGLRGLGMAFLVYHFIYFVSLFLISRFRYQLTLLPEFSPVFSVCFLLVLLTFLSSLVTNPYWKLGLSGFLLILSLVYSYVQLDKKINFKSLIAELLNQDKK